MATVVPDRQDTFTSDTLKLAQYLAGNKQFDKQLELEKEKLKLQKEQAPTDEERSVELNKTKETIKYLQEQAMTMAANRKLESDMAESERQLRVAQAAGLKEQTKELKAKNDYLGSLTSDEDKRAYYLQDALMQQNNALKTQLQSAGMILDAMKQDATNKQNALLNARNWFEAQFGPDIRSAAGTPFSAEVNSTSRTLADLLQNPDASPEAVQSARDAHNDVLKRVSDFGAQKELEMFKTKAGVTQTGSLESQKVGAIQQNQKSLLANPDMFKGGKTGEDYQNFVMAVASGQLMGQDFNLSSAQSGFLPDVPLIYKKDYKFTFVPTTKTGQPSVQQKLKAVTGQ